MAGHSALFYMRSLASRAGGWRAPAAPWAAARPVGRPAHAELREAFLGLVRTALRAEDLGVPTEDELLEAFLAVAALIFVDGHVLTPRQGDRV